MKALPWDQWNLLGYRPNGWALENVHNSEARFNYFCTCRQCGKTYTLAALLFEALTKPPDAFGPPQVGILSFDYKHALISVNRLRRWMAANDIPFKQNANERRLWLPWNKDASLYWLSAKQDPHATAGETWSWFGVDEAQGVPDEVYQIMRPGLDVRRSPLYVFGTPDVDEGQTWFEGGYRRGQMADQENYNSFTLPVTRNPWMTPETIREAREGNMTEEKFRMLYLGQWIQLANKVFRWDDIDKARRVEQLLGPRPERSYVMGLDIAQTHDYTVAYVMEIETKDIVFRWRKSRLDYTLVGDMVTQIAKAFNVRTVMLERNGPGAVVVDILRAKGVPVHDITLGNANKGDIIEHAAADTQFKRIGLPEGDPQLITELKAYLRKPTPGGRMGYGAPEGYFDDSVIAFAYAAEAARISGTLQVGSYLHWGQGSLIEAGRRLA